MLKPKTITIDGTEYVLGHWEVKKALETWAWLLQSLGETVSEFWKIAQKQETSAELSKEERKEKESEMMLEAFGLMVSTLRENIPSAEYARRMIDFCSDVAGPNGALKPPFIEFQGKLLTMHKLVVQVLAFQYADFLDGALSILKE